MNEVNVSVRLHQAAARLQALYESQDISNNDLRNELGELIRELTPVVAGLPPGSAEGESAASDAVLAWAFPNAFYAAAIGMALVRPNGVYEQVNPAFCEIVGYGAEEIVGVPFGAITHPDDLEAHQQQSRRLLAGEIEHFHLEKRYIQKLGSTVWASLTVSSVSDGNGLILYQMHQVQDITARRESELALRKAHEELEQQVERRTSALARMNDALQEEIGERRATEAELMKLNATLEERIAERASAVMAQSQELRREKEFSELLIQSSVDGIIAFDRDCRFTVWNSGMERLTGLAAGEALGRPAFEVLPFLVDVGEDRSLLATLAGCWTESSEHAFRITQTGKEGYFEGHYSPLRAVGGDIVGGLGIIRDITDRKLAEHQALQAERLAAVGQMIAGMAHESRNALQRSQACLDVLSMKISDRPEVHDLIARIQSAQDHLHQLYEEVRSYAAPIKLDPTNVDVSEILLEAWEGLRGDRASRQLQLEMENFDGDRHCRIDSSAMRQVFYNVLENSVTACQDPVQIKVDWYQGLLGSRPALIIVMQDNGPGLNAEQLMKIFEPFYTTKVRGTGLGMAIAKRYVEAHGGRISARPAEQSGAEIQIILPRK